MASVTTEADLLTADEFADLFGPDDRVELVDGKVVYRMAPDPFHGYMVMLLGHFFQEWIQTHDDYWVYTETGTILNSSRRTVRCPDIALMAWADTPRPMLPGKFPQMTPVLVVEVLSVNETAADRDAKKRDWFAAGLKEFWEVDLKEFTIRIEQPDGQANTWFEAQADVISNPAGLTGITVALKRLFAKLVGLR